MMDYIPNAEPFYYPGNRVGCLLIHGFTGTPYEMRELGKRLASNGYTVSGPALAGHATCLADLAPTRWQDWYSSVTDAYIQIRQRCDLVFPIGLSLGAILALHLSASEPVDGVIALSPPFTIRNPLIPIFRLFPFLFDLIPYVNKNPKNDDTEDPSVRLLHPEYRANPTRCAASLLFGLLPIVRNELPRIKVPVLLIQSRGDRVITPDSIGRYYALLGSLEKRMEWLDRSGHLVLEDYAKERAFSLIQDFVQEQTVAAEIKSLDMMQTA